MAHLSTAIRLLVPVALAAMLASSGARAQDLKQKAEPQQSTRAETIKRQRTEEMRQRVLAAPEQVIGAAMQTQGGDAGATELTASAAAVTRARLKQQAAQLAPERYEPTLAEAAGLISRDGATVTRVGLIEGVTYAFVAVCNDCSHVRLALLDAGGAVLAVTPETTGSVILTGPAPATAEYLIELQAPGCQAERCHGGFSVLRRPRSAAAPVASSPAAPRTEPERGASPAGSAARPPSDGRLPDGPPVGATTTPTAAARLEPERPAQLKANETRVRGAQEEARNVDLVRALRLQLKRFGCDPIGQGGWDTTARAALSEFARVSRLALPTDSPTQEALVAVSGWSGPGCRPKCAGSETEIDGRCVARAPPAKAKPAERAPAPPPRPQQQQAAPSAPERPTSGSNVGACGSLKGIANDPAIRALMGC